MPTGLFGNSSLFKILFIDKELPHSFFMCLTLLCSFGCRGEKTPGTWECLFLQFVLPCFT